MVETKNFTKTVHNIKLENRNKMHVSGVEFVDNFNSELIVLKTAEEVLTIKGRDLNINKLSLEDRNVLVNGTVYSLIYTEKGVLGVKGRGLLSKLFK